MRLCSVPERSQRIEVVVGGWTPGQGNRTNTLGAFLLGLPGPHTTVDGQGLVFVGAVGTGWTQATATRLFRQLGELASDTSPFSEPLPRLYARNARWVRPALIGDVEYRSRTAEGYLRHPMKGLRLGHTGRLITAETPAASGPPGLTGADHLAICRHARRSTESEPLRWDLAAGRAVGACGVSRRWRRAPGSGASDRRCHEHVHAQVLLTEPPKTWAIDEFDPAVLGGLRPAT
jgi:hypothetical protein